MPLSGRLLPIKMSFSCPACRLPIVKTGGWFQTMKHFVCESCGSSIHLSYGDKLKLFEAHADLSPEQ
jgi:transposase-like protein